MRWRPAGGHLLRLKPRLASLVQHLSLRSCLWWPCLGRSSGRSARAGSPARARARPARSVARAGSRAGRHDHSLRGRCGWRARGRGPPAPVIAPDGAGRHGGGRTGPVSAMSRRWDIAAGAGPAVGQRAAGASGRRQKNEQTTEQAEYRLVSARLEGAPRGPFPCPPTGWCDFAKPLEWRENPARTDRTFIGLPSGPRAGRRSPFAVFSVAIAHPGHVPRRRSCLPDGVDSHSGGAACFKAIYVAAVVAVAGFSAQAACAASLLAEVSVGEDCGYRDFIDTANSADASAASCVGGASSPGAWLTAGSSSARASFGSIGTRVTTSNYSIYQSGWGWVSALSQPPVL